MQMNCDKYEIYISGLIDRELPDKEKKELFTHLGECDNCFVKYKQIQNLKGNTMKLKEHLSLNMDSEKYWQGIYNKTERSISWLLIILGGSILFLFGIFHVFNDFWHNPEIPFMIKIGAGVFVLGIFLLLLSVLREKLFIRKSDKYREIKL